MEPSSQKNTESNGFETSSYGYGFPSSFLQVEENTKKSLAQDKKGRVKLDLNRLNSKTDLQILFHKSNALNSNALNKPDQVPPLTARARYTSSTCGFEEESFDESCPRHQKAGRPRSKSFEDKSHILPKQDQESIITAPFSPQVLKIEKGFFNRKKSTFNETLKKRIREASQNYKGGVSYEDLRKKISAFCQDAVHEISRAVPTSEGHIVNAEALTSVPLAAIKRAMDISTKIDTSISLVMPAQENLKLLLTELEDLFETSNYIATHKALKLRTFLHQVTTWDDLDNSVSEFARFFKERLTDLDEKERSFVLQALCREGGSALTLLKILEDWNVGFKNIKNIALELLAFYYPTQKLFLQFDASDKTHPSKISISDLKRAFMPEDRVLFKEIRINGASLPLQFKVEDLKQATTQNPKMAQNLFYTRLLAELFKACCFEEKTTELTPSEVAHHLVSDGPFQLDDPNLTKLLTLLKCGTINAWKPAHELFLSLFPALADKSQIWTKCEQGIGCHIEASGDELSLTQIKKYGIYDAKILNFDQENCLVEFEVAWKLRFLENDRIEGCLTLPIVEIHETPKLSKQYLIYKTFGLTTEAIDHALNQTSCLERVERNDKKH